MVIMKNGAIAKMIKGTFVDFFNFATYPISPGRFQKADNGPSISPLPASQAIILLASQLLHPRTSPSTRLYHPEPEEQLCLYALPHF